MKHQTLDELLSIAEVHPELTHVPMHRDKRLERWAELLESNPSRALTTLEGTEYQPLEARHLSRADGSPITVAFDDPVLRAEGLRNDTYGEAKRFFEISDRQLHEVVCDCLSGPATEASRAARQVRRAISGNGLFARIREVFF